MLSQRWKVDVHHPDVLLRVEICQKVNLFSLMILDRVVCLSVPMVRQCYCFPVVLDSPVAGYMIAKRGVKIDAVYFHAPPYTSERAKQKVVDLPIW